MLRIKIETPKFKNENQNVLKSHETNMINFNFGKEQEFDYLKNIENIDISGIFSTPFM